MSSARLIDGRAIAARISEQTASPAAALRPCGPAALRDRGVVPALAIVVPNDDPGAAWYVRSLQRLAARVGVEGRVHQWPGPASADTVLSKLAELSADPAVHGARTRPGTAA